LAVPADSTAVLKMGKPNADRVCDKSPFRHRVQNAVAYAQVHDTQRTVIKPLVFFAIPKFRAC